MVRTNNGFEIAETDLKLRGPGDLMGTQQSGALDLLIADLGKDGQILEQARIEAKEILSRDPELRHQFRNRSKTGRFYQKTVVNWRQDKLVSRAINFSIKKADVFEIAKLTSCYPLCVYVYSFSQLCFCLVTLCELNKEIISYSLYSVR